MTTMTTTTSMRQHAPWGVPQPKKWQRQHQHVCPTTPKWWQLAVTCNKWWQWLPPSMMMMRDGAWDVYISWAPGKSFSFFLLISIYRYTMNHWHQPPPLRQQSPPTMMRLEMHMRLEPQVCFFSLIFLIYFYFTNTLHATINPPPHSTQLWWWQWRGGTGLEMQHVSSPCNFFLL